MAGRASGSSAVAAKPLATLRRVSFGMQSSLCLAGNVADRDGKSILRTRFGISRGGTLPAAQPRLLDRGDALDIALLQMAAALQDLEGVFLIGEAEALRL